LEGFRSIGGQKIAPNHQKFHVSATFWRVLALFFTLVKKTKPRFQLKNPPQTQPALAALIAQTAATS
jgi:hypothetical protein